MKIPYPEKEASDEEIRQAAAVLSKLPAGYLPKEIFLEVTRLCVTPIAEVVPLRQSSSGTTEVLLLQRPDDDPNWPSMLHTPGTVIRATDIDKGIEGSLERIIDSEIGVRTEKKPILVGLEFHQVARGPEMAQVYAIDLTGDKVTNGVWYSVDNLPPNIVDTQLGFIARAIDSYENRQSR